MAVSEEGMTKKKIECYRLGGPEGQGSGLRLERNESCVWNGGNNIPGTGNKKFKGLEALLMCSRNDKNALQLPMISRYFKGTCTYGLSLRKLA